MQPEKQSEPTIAKQPEKQGEPIIAQRRRGGWFLFLFGLVAGVALAVAWPSLKPIATCVQDIAENGEAIPTRDTPEGDAEWVKTYGAMRSPKGWERAFGPTYNQLLDFYFKYRRPAPPYPNATQEAKDAYPGKLEEWKQRMCKLEGLCVAKIDASGVTEPQYSDTPAGFHPVR